MTRPCPTGTELLSSRLLRSAQGNRAEEAAIVFLVDGGRLTTVTPAVVIDSEQNLAWIDWLAVRDIAQRAPDDTRAVLLRATALAASGRQPCSPGYLRGVPPVSTGTEHPTLGWPKLW